VDVLEKHSFVFSGESEKDEGIMQIGELTPEKHAFFIGAQGHPEFTSRPLKPKLASYFRDDEYVSKTAKKADDASQLIESGFEYVCTTPDDLMLFRKKK
jgi:CTP synthase (UTP-ammonia lyase)